jgi:hypothetical protein
MVSKAAPALYTTRIIKAGALLGDTKTLLACWETGASVAANLDRCHRDNVFGKASRSRVEDILAVFRQRYLADEAVAQALAALVRQRLPAEDLDKILYFHAATADALLHDVVTCLLAPLSARGATEAVLGGVLAGVRRWVEEGRTTARWSDATTLRVVQGLLSALRDFGIFRGAVHKRIAPVYLPLRAFVYVAFHLRQQQPSGAKLLEHPDWKLFFLGREGVERRFIEADQSGLLEYHAAGSVVRINFPAKSLEELAYALTERPH